MKKDTKEIINSAVGPLQLCEFVTAKSGHFAKVFRDGTFLISESTQSKYAQPIASIKCLGIENIDESYWTYGWTKYDEESGNYIVTEGSDGCNPGDHLTLEQCIYICCADGDVVETVDDLRTALYEDAFNWENI